MAMTQAIQAASQTSYRRRAAAFNNFRRAKLPLFQALLRFSDQGTTEYHCIKDGTPIDSCCGSGVFLIRASQLLFWQKPSGKISKGKKATIDLAAFFQSF